MTNLSDKPYIKFDFDLEMDHSTSTDDLPTITQNTLKQETQDSFDKGYQQGLMDATQGITQHIDSVIHQVEQQLDHLITVQEEAMQQSAIDSCALTQIILEKFLPQLVADNALSHIQQIIDQTQRQFPKDIPINLALNSQLCNEMQRYIDQHQLTQRITIVSDDSLSVSDCRIEWQGGGIESYFNQLQANLSDSLAKLSPSSLKPTNQNSQSELTSDTVTQSTTITLENEGRHVA